MAGTESRGLKAEIKIESIDGWLILFFSRTQDQVPRGVTSDSWMGHATSLLIRKMYHKPVHIPILWSYLLSWSSLVSDDTLNCFKLKNH